MKKVFVIVMIFITIIVVSGCRDTTEWKDCASTNCGLRTADPFEYCTNCTCIIGGCTNKAANRRLYCMECDDRLKGR